MAIHICIRIISNKDVKYMRIEPKDKVVFQSNDFFDALNCFTSLNFVKFDLLNDTDAKIIFTAKASAEIIALANSGD